MTNAFLISAGALAIIVAIAHGLIGEEKVIRPIQKFKDLPASARRIVRAIWAVSVFYWLAGGVALIAVGYFFDGWMKMPVALVTITMYSSGAIANFWATRGRHMGWVMLAIVVGLICAGIATEA